MTDLYRNADDPLGVAFDVMVPCDTCGGEHPNLCSACRGSGQMPNPDITQECGTCGGKGYRLVGLVEPEDLPCPDCEGRGWTFCSSVRVAERVRVVDYDDTPTEDCVAIVDRRRQQVVLNTEMGEDITRLWPEHRQGDFRCLLCGEPWPCSAEESCPDGRGKPTLCGPLCPTCRGKGTIRTFPKPGELWEIGWREAELVPVRRYVEEGGGTLPCITVDDEHGNVILWPMSPRSPEAVAAHFPDGVKPGQRAGVLGGLVLADKARKVE